MEIGTSANYPWPSPVGYRFSPTDAELVCYYLKNKAMNDSIEDPTNRFQELELYNFSPEQLREKYGEQKEREMYVFVKKILKHRNGTRLQRRTTSNGHWLACSRKQDIVFDGRLVGHRVNLVYRIGEGRGTKTDWLMHEYRLPDHMMLDEWILCKVYLKKHEEIKTRANAVVKPHTVPCKQECSWPFSAPATAEQSTAMISSDDEIHWQDFDYIIPPDYLSIVMDWQSKEADSVSHGHVQLQQ
ncbi:hypothetical protein TIFTF001_023322 [Ficus carica]|uniref:NAC domain-containing protein n=1 Tax=Ficus carica TaxID=3494 RepID=A0AA88AEH0_FICCA|nr:hypothetical protein TIFTF001_023322 [Ficus carica]